MLSLLDHPSLELLSNLLCLSYVLTLTCVAWKYIQAKRSPLNAIPTVGYSGVLTSYITAFKWMQYSTELLQEGYDRYPGQAFKVATISRWVVVLSGKQHMEDIRKAPGDVVSFREALAEISQTRYTLGRRIDDDRFGDLRDEINESFKELIPLTEDWTPVPAYNTLIHIVCRTSNRYFVGLPLCRDPGYCALNETFARDVAISARIINCFPDFLKPLVGRYLTTVPKSAKRALGYLKPMLEERLAQEKQYGAEWNERPNDLISWLLETATQDYHRDPHDLVLRILLVNFVAIHTSTMAVTQALFDLAIHPEYAEDMRKEVEAIIAEDGWTKPAMQRMRKVDSFLKESQRLNSGGSMLMTRKTLKDWTLSDGTLIPAGSLFGVAGDAMNKEEMTSQDAHTFKGFRYAELRAGDDRHDGIKHQMVFVSPDRVVFGYGRHACPGGFFAANEIKAIFAHILLNYDVQFEGGSSERPKNIYLGALTIPNTKAKVLFRKRRA